MGALAVVLAGYQLNQKGNQLKNFQISVQDEEYVEDRFECNIALSYETCPGVFETLVVRAEEELCKSLFALRRIARADRISISLAPVTVQQ